MSNPCNSIGPNNPIMLWSRDRLVCSSGNLLNLQKKYKENLLQHKTSIGGAVNASFSKKIKYSYMATRGITTSRTYATQNNYKNATNPNSLNLTRVGNTLIECSPPT